MQSDNFDMKDAKFDMTNAKFDMTGAKFNITGDKFGIMGAKFHSAGDIIQQKGYLRGFKTNNYGKKINIRYLEHPQQFQQTC